MAFRIQGVMYMIIRGDRQTINYYKPLVNSSDDRLKENEELIENACETLSKWPQLCDKEPDIDNDGTTKWYREGGLIAQEVYYDCVELRHLVHRESNSELLDIPTSIGPSQDPGYSSCGKDSASVNYIGLIAYLVKADTELHERVKAWESK